MVQLGFNTGISGINKPAVEGVKTTQLTAFPSSVKQNIKKQVTSNITNETLGNLGRLGTKTNQDDAMVGLAISMVSGQDKNTIMNEYYNKVSNDNAAKVSQLIKSIEDGYDLDSIKGAYPDINSDVIDDIYDGYRSIYAPASGVKNFASGILGKLPKMLANIIKTAVDIGTPTAVKQMNDYVKNTINTEAGYEAYKTPTDIAENRQKLSENAAKDITRFIGGDVGTKGYKAGELVSELASYFAIPSMGAEKASIGATEFIGTKLPALQKFIENPIINKILKKSLTSIPATEVNKITSEGRLATPKELVGGAIIQNVIPGGNKRYNRNKKLENILSEQDNKAGMELGRKLGNIKTNSGRKKFWTGKEASLVKTDRTEAAIKEVKKQLPNLKKVRIVDLADEIMGKAGTSGKRSGGLIEKVSDEYSSMLSKLNIGTMTKEKSVFVKKMQEIYDNYVDEMSIGGQKQAKKLIQDMKNAKTLDDVWKITKEFNTHFSDKMKSGLSDSVKDREVYKLWKPLQDETKDFIGNTAEKLGQPGAKELRGSLASLEHAKKQIENNWDIFLKPKKGAKKIISNTLGSIGKLWVLGKVLGSMGQDKRGIDTSTE